MFNYSFWADEAYISGISAQWITGKISLFTALNAPAIAYQKLQMIIIGVFFKFFGVSEFVARLPSLITFFLGIGVIFLLAKKLNNIYGALISSFLYAFSHLNLAYATQAKPYSALETIMLTILLLIAHLEKQNNKLHVILYNLLIISLLIIATLLHNIGVLLWIVYGIYLILNIKHFKFNKLQFIYVVFGLVTISCIFVLPILLTSIKKDQFLPYNHLYQSIKLLAYKYSFISACAFFGFVWSFKNNKKIDIILFFYSFIVLFMAIFWVYIFNIRYILSLFAIIFLYFGIFWAKVGEKYKKNFQFSIFNFQLDGRSIIPIIVIIILYTTGYKIARFPQAYYNPNIDKYGDIQIANYKDFYSQLKNKFPNYKDIYTINDIYDVEYWYFGRYSNAYFMKFTLKPYKHHTVNATIYGSLDDFKKIIKNQPQGLLIMEDWESFLPEDVKQYAKKNLKLEFRVESLKEAPDDPWPLALYSWGMEPKVPKF